MGIVQHWPRVSVADTIQHLHPFHWSTCTSVVVPLSKMSWTPELEDVCHQVSQATIGKTSEFVESPFIETLRGVATDIDIALNVGVITTVQASLAKRKTNKKRKERPVFPPGAFSPDQKKKEAWTTTLPNIDDMTWLLALLKEIEKHAGEHDLFRKSGGEKAVKRLMRKINEDCNYSDYASVSKHDLVGLFKRFINNLAEPLIPWNQVEFWLQVANMTKGKEDAARLLMLLLPTNRRLVCKRLFECLFEIYTANVTAVARSPKEATRRLDSDGLAICIGPSVLKEMSRGSKTTAEECLEGTRLINDIIKYIIENYTDIFEGPKCDKVISEILDISGARDTGISMPFTPRARPVPKTTAQEYENQVNRYTQEATEKLGGQLKRKLEIELSQTKPDKEKVKIFREELRKFNEGGAFAGTPRKAKKSNILRNSSLANIGNISSAFQLRKARSHEDFLSPARKLDVNKPRPTPDQIRRMLSNNPHAFGRKETFV